MRVLREYIYVDPEKVHGLAGQLFDGVPESVEDSDAASSRKQLGSSRLAFVNGERGTSSTESGTCPALCFRPSRMSLKLRATS